MPEIFVCGEARYTDIFGHPHVTKSRHFVRFRGPKNAIDLACAIEGNSMT
jgi:hypothetical protein